MGFTRRWRVVPACLFIIGIWGFAAAGDNVRTSVLLDDGDRIVVQFAFESFASRSVAIGAETYEEITIEGEAINLSPGAPALPHVSRSLIIPDDAEMTFRVLASSHRERLAKIAPSKGNLLRNVDPATVPYEFGTVYRLNAYYPASIGSIENPYIMRDHRGVVVRINPVQYNPVTGLLREYSEITVEIEVAGAGQVNVLERTGRSSRGGRAWDAVYRSHFLNHSGRVPTQRYDAIQEDGSMLIIGHDAWLGNMGPFVAHKNSVGISTTIVGISGIGNNTVDIKDYIQSVYDTSDLAYVLLVGDIAEIASPNSSGGKSDPSYSKLAGNDDYPEIIIGRFSAGTAAEVDTQVERTIAYETQGVTEQDWFWKGIGMASAEGAGIGDEGQSDIVHENEIRSWLLGAGYTEVDQIYDPGASGSAVSDAVDAGRGVINYTGHGSTFSWSTTGFHKNDVNALTNVGKLPFILSVACVNGEFDATDACFAEAWLRATHNGSPTGAAAFYGSSINQSWAPPMEGQDEFNMLLTDPTEPYHTFGGLCFAASSQMMDAYGSSGASMFDTWHIFGDPSLRVRGSAGSPTGLRVSPNTAAVVEGPAGGPFAPVTLQYTLENLDQTPLEYELLSNKDWASADQDRGTIAPGGSTTITITVNGSASNLDNGHYGAALEFLNLSNGDGNTSRSLALTVGVPLLLHQALLDTTPSWAIESKWQFGQPLGNGGNFMGNPDPDSGASGDNVYGFALQGDYAPQMGGPFYLTAGPFDLGDALGSTLKFQRWLNAESLPFAEATVEVSSDGSSWSEIWSNSTGVLDDAWSLQQYDASAVADGQSAVYFRWGLGVYEDATPCSGWNIDDVEIWAAPETTARVELTVDSDSISWTSVVGAISYDVVRGDLDTLRQSGGDFTLAADTCAANDLQGQTLTAENPPDPGKGFWYLVRGVAPTGPMTYQALFESQVGLRDDEIDAATSTCP